jgi:hypothetical protein
MKKLVFIPLMVISMSLCAQTFQFGLKGGLNISNFTGTTFENVDNKALLGFHGGALLSLLFGDNFAIQPEALFSTQGTRVSTIDGNENYRVSYINIPVMFKYRFNGGFYLEAGPQVGFKINESVPNQQGGTAEDFARNMDFALDAGLGFHGKSGIGVGGRYVLGISKVGRVDDTNFNPSFRNGVAQIFVFFTFLNNKNNP